MPPLIRLYIRNVLLGFGLSAAFVTALLWFNVANLWHLVSTSDMGFVAVIMLFMFNGIVFAGVQAAIAIMRLGDEENPPTRGKKQRVFSKPAPVNVAEKR